MPDALRRIAVLTHYLPEMTAAVIPDLVSEAQRLGLQLCAPRDEFEKHGLKSGQGFELIGEDALAGVDLCLVFGGDGTMLRALGRLLGSGVPTTGSTSATWGSWPA
jgi:NAD+ kinase